MQPNKPRRTGAWIAVLAAVTIALPLSATVITDASAAPAQAQLPKNLAKYKSPLPEARTKQVIEATAAKYGPGKAMIPRFKANSSPEQRKAAIKGLDNVAKLAKSDSAVTPMIKDSIKIWEAMTPAQKNEALAESQAVVAAWPAGVAATAAAVAAGAAVVDVVYKVYVDQREEAEEDEKEADDGGQDGGDTGTDTGAIKVALSY
jgi:hypothetical protein